MSATETPVSPLVQLGQLAHLATLGTTLARLLDRADVVVADPDDAAAIAAARAQLAAVTRDAIQDTLMTVAAALDTAEARGYVAAVPLSVTQAASVLGLTPDGVRRAILQGRLPATKHGGVWALSAAAVRAYATATRQPGGRPRQEPPR